MTEPASKKNLEKSNDVAPQIEKVASPVRRRRSALFLLSLCLAVVVFILLTALVKASPSFAIDLQVTRAIQSISSPAFAIFMQLVSWPGFLPQSVLITVLIAILLDFYGMRWEAAVSLLASTLSGLTNELIKDLIRRPRPAIDVVDVFAVLDSYSFPSGHVMFYTILFGFVCYVAYTGLKRSLLRSLLLSALGMLILLVGLSRIYLGQHWASDVLGAYLLGGLILVAMVLLHRWGRSRFFVHRPTAGSSRGNKHDA